MKILHVAARLPGRDSFDLQSRPLRQVCKYILIQTLFPADALWMI